MNPLVNTTPNLLLAGTAISLGLGGMIHPVLAVLITVLATTNVFLFNRLGHKTPSPKLRPIPIETRHPHRKYKYRD